MANIYTLIRRYTSMDDDDPYVYRWFFGRLSNNQAKKLLINLESTDGYFLVYENTSIAGFYVTSVVFNNQILHYNINRQLSTDRLYIEKHYTFSNLSQLILHYRDISNIDTKLQCPLVYPVYREKGLRPLSYLGSNLSRARLNVEVDDEIIKWKDVKRWQCEQLVLRRMHIEQCWYFNNLTSEQAENILNMDHTNGMFLVRKRNFNTNLMSADSSVSAKYALSVRLNNQIRHIYIHQEGLQVRLSARHTNQSTSKLFGSLVQLIDYLFRDHSILKTNLMVNERVFDKIKSNSRQLMKTQFSADICDQNIDVDKSQLRITKQIGKGFFGVVFKGTLSRPNGKSIDVAIKALKSNRVDSRSENECIKEGKIMQSLDHPNIVKFYGFKYYNKKALMVLEYTSCGSLLSRLKSVSQLDFNTINSYIYQIASGMGYLASKYIVHRDLAARNVLLFDNFMIAKITDFGLAKFMTNREIYAAGRIGQWPIQWYPPESIMAGKFSEKSDVWSAAVTLWEMWNPNKPLYPGVPSLYDYLLQGYHLSLNRVNEKHARLMKECWNLDPKRRPSFKRIQSMLYFENQLKK